MLQRWRTGFRFWFLTLGMLAAGNLSAHAQQESAKPAATPAPATGQTLTYAVYAGGLHVVEGKLELGGRAKGRYRIALSAWTRGFLGTLVPWNGTFETVGWRAKGAEAPEIYKSASVWHGSEEIKQFTYGRDGKFKGFTKTDAGKDTTPKSFDRKLADDTIDTLTATLLVMDNVGKGGKCEGSKNVFDGLRRFKLVFHHDAEETLIKTDYNVYAGPAVRCTVEVVPDGGLWHEKPRGWLSIQEQGRQKGSLPTVWLAKVDKDGPAVPVKVRVVTNYGTLFMHLSDYQGAGGKVTASAAPEDSGR